MGNALRALKNPAVLEQRIGRIHRLGQRRPIDVYNLVSEPGIESRIADLVGSKKAFFAGLFDGTTDEVAFERSGSFLSRGLQALRGSRRFELRTEPEPELSSSERLNNTIRSACYHPAINGGVPRRNRRSV
jgi:hypothetical protein